MMYLCTTFNPNRSLDFTSFCFYLRCLATISSKASGLCRDGTGSKTAKRKAKRTKRPYNNNRILLYVGLMTDLGLYQSFALWQAIDSQQLIFLWNFSLQKVTFRSVKGNLLSCQRSPFIRPTVTLCQAHRMAIHERTWLPSRRIKVSHSRKYHFHTPSVKLEGLRIL